MEYTALLLFTVAASITPGPNNIMIMTSGVNYGFRRSLPHLFGIDIGFALMVVAVGLGMSQLFEEVPELIIWLKLIGLLYLVYLAFRIATSPTQPIKSVHLIPQNPQPLSFMQGALFQWVNPKAWIMVIGAVVTYTVAQIDYTLQIGIIALFFLFFGTPCTFLWLSFGTALKPYLSSPKHLKIFNIAMATLLLLSLVPVVKELITVAFK